MADTPGSNSETGNEDDITAPKTDRVGNDYHEGPSPQPQALLH